MSNPPRILAFAGSARRESLNRRLLRIAAEGATAAGAAVTELDLGELDLPLYNADLEASSGLPAGALRLKTLMGGHDGLLIAAPEYNSSITPLLKNAIDWASRPATRGEAPLSAYRGKVAALIAASPGALGGLRGLRHVREILSNISVLVLPEQHAVAKAHEEFAADGALKDAALADRLRGIGARLAEVIAALRPATG